MVAASSSDSSSISSGGGGGRRRWPRQRSDTVFMVARWGRRWRREIAHRVTDDGWQTTNDGRTADRRWKTDGRRQTDDGRQTTNDGRTTTDDVRRRTTTTDDRRRTDDGNVSGRKGRRRVRSRRPEGGQCRIRPCAGLYTGLSLAEGRAGSCQHPASLQNGNTWTGDSRRVTGTAPLTGRPTRPRSVFVTGRDPDG